MRKLIVSTYLTLDDIMSLDGDMAQRWHFPFFNDELARYSHQQLFAADALLLGRRTYDGFAASWQPVTDKQGFADRMNHLPKYVVSTTLATADWTRHPAKPAKPTATSVGRCPRHLWPRTPTPTPSPSPSPRGGPLPTGSPCKSRNTHLIAGSRACPTSTPADPSDHHHLDKPARCPGPGQRCEHARSSTRQYLHH